MTDKKLQKVDHSIEDKAHVTKLTFDDNSNIYIVIDLGMIFVCPFDAAELTRRIDADEIDSYEAYDMCDGISYYRSSQYHEYIDDALIDLAMIHLKQLNNL